MDRREFLATGLAAMGAGVAVIGSPARASTPVNTFKLKYAPHFRMFRHHAGDDPIDQIKFMADEGFTALEDNGMMNRPVELQEMIRQEMERLGMTMGVFVAYANFQDRDFVSGKKDLREGLLKRMRKAVEL